RGMPPVPGGRGAPAPQPVASAQPMASTGSTQSTQSTAGRHTTYAEIAANAALVLIAVACSLLARQIEAQAAAFEREGGFTERLYRIRSNRRNHS
ncbi:MAG TPA: four helix bundle suffix domain-containing protein, partial [Opitutaceae bacterium]|nr:four helix bundle suffix domain-containing protein [Opitutaceae bacterium]